MQQSLSPFVGQASRPVGLPNGTTQERWSTTARQHITAVSKGVSEILAALSEPFMRYSTIYLALATSIPVVKWMPFYTLCQGIVIAAPEFVLLGALSIAEQACKGSQKMWGILLYIVSILLAGIMVATFVDIFIVTFPDMAVKCLNFARCLVAVSFSVVLGKLEKDVPEHSGHAQTVTVHPVSGSSLPSSSSVQVHPVSGQGSQSMPLDQSGQLDRTERTSDLSEDKLTVTLRFLREHPERRGAEDLDAQLAEILGLKRAASARFWRLKAEEMLRASDESLTDNEPGTYQRLLLYVQSNPPVTRKEMAEALSLSERTIRRHLAAMKKSGQLPANWTADSKADSGQLSND